MRSKRAVLRKTDCGILFSLFLERIWAYKAFHLFIIVGGLGTGPAFHAVAVGEPFAVPVGNVVTD